MAERKGLFGRLFGRKSKPEEEAPEAETKTGATDAPAPEQGRPDNSGVPSLTGDMPEPADRDEETAPKAEESHADPALTPRTEAEEMEDLDAAHSTMDPGQEPVVLVERTDDRFADDTAPTAEEKPVEPEPPHIEDTSTAPAADISEDPHDDISQAMAPEVAAEDALHEAEEMAAEAEAAPLSEPEPDMQPEDIQEAPAKKRGLFGRLRDGLAKTSAKLSGGIGSIFTQRKLDDETLEELEDLLITADLGLPATTRIITTLSKSKYDQEITDDEVRSILAEEVASTLKPLEAPLEVNPSHRPHVILMTGVNGAGKTTTIGKLAKKFSDDGHSVLLAAGDTFRAAAIEQLTVWGERVGVPVVAKETGADAAGLAFDAIKRARDENIDVVLIDTAGRLQNRKELMEELGKIVRVIKKLVPEAPHDTVLVLDATVGQNALSQAESFLQTAAISGLVMTKLDGTARGGVLVALGDKFALPIHYIGVGEAVEDLQAFDAAEFAQALTARGE
ncbi:MAG: signal recognition particle-docking protein FtsY [Pseudomonadota bacterium]